MAKHAIWRDVSKTSATGLYLPEFRLKMPNGEAILKLTNDAIFNADNPVQGIFCLRCSSVGIANESTGERDIEKAKKAAENLLRKRMRDTITAYEEDLAALDNIVTREHKAVETSKPRPAPSSASTARELPVSSITKKRAKAEQTKTPTKKAAIKRTLTAATDKAVNSADTSAGRKTPKHRGKRM